MNHLVPDFHEMEADFAIPASGNFSRPRKTTLDEDEIMELMWQNGQVVVQKSANKPPYVGGGGEAAEQAVVREIRGSAAEEGQHLFMQEDEMASWLQYPIEDSSFTRDLYADDLFYTAPITSAAPTHSVAEIRPQPAPPRPPIPPPPQKSGVSNSPRVHTFGHFSRLPSRPRIGPASRPLLATVRESTVVESNETPMAAAPPDTGVSNSRRQVYNNTVNGGNATGRGELGGVPCELTVTSSLDGGASFSATAMPNPPNEKAEAAEDRKRKAREDDDNECQSEDFECEAAEAKKKQSRGSTSTKRSRAAEVHNLSERRRRDRINEKMKALQELIPRCNKSDKASMLDEAIEYMKSLQMQLQMMSMGCGMVPMMYPGMQQYMPAMVMGMGMNRPMMPPYPSMIPGSPMQNPTNIGPRFPMPPGFHLPQVPLPDNNSRVEGSNSNNPAPNSLASHNTNQQRAQNFVDPYQHQFLGLHQPQSPSPQNQAVVQLTVKQNTNKEDRHPENKQSGRK